MYWADWEISQGLELCFPEIYEFALYIFITGAFMDSVNNIVNFWKIEMENTKLGQKTHSHTSCFLACGASYFS